MTPALKAYLGSMCMQANSRVAVVTGGARGIGRAISLQLASRGYAVVIATRTLEPALATVETMGGTSHAVSLDVSDYSAVKTVMAQILADHGHIDVLVNNAGGSARGDMSLFRYSEEPTWQRVLASNLMGVMYTTREVINPMLDRGYGRIINIASVAGTIGTAGQVDYSASKGAVIAFSSALAKETAGKGITVNCVSPGPTSSEAAREMTPESIRDTPYERLANATGYGRFAQADEVASMVVYLASEEAGFITGQNHPVCGVMNLGLPDQLGGKPD